MKEMLEIVVGCRVVGMSIKRAQGLDPHSTLFITVESEDRLERVTIGIRAEHGRDLAVNTSIEVEPMDSSRPRADESWDWRARGQSLFAVRTRVTYFEARALPATAPHAELLKRLAGRVVVMCAASLANDNDARTQHPTAADHQGDIGEAQMTEQDTDDVT